MKKRDEVLVGLVITVAVIVVVLGSLWLARGGLSKGYPLYVKFPWGAGLKQGQPVLLVGVNVGPNLTYVGSLATLLWRRIVHAHDEETDIGEFTRLGVRTVPAILLSSTVCLWLALQVL